MIYVLFTSASSWQRNDAITIFFLAFVFLGTRIVFHKSLKGPYIPLRCLDQGKFKQFLWERFGNILERSLKGHRKSE